MHRSCQTWCLDRVSAGWYAVRSADPPTTTKETIDGRHPPRPHPAGRPAARSAPKSRLDKIKLLDPAAALRAVGAPALALAGDRLLARTRRTGRNLTDEEREWAVWGMSAFFVGEERVTTQFSGLVMAYEDEQEEAFLTTQQVDEARHMQFFDRFYREVIGLERRRTSRIGWRGCARTSTTPSSSCSTRRSSRPGQRLIADPSDLEAKVDFITTYHMVIEGTLALTGQWTSSPTTGRRRQDAGLRRGLQERGARRAPPRRLRHLVPEAGLRGRRARSPIAMRAKLAELLPIASGVLVPPGQDPNEDGSCSATPRPRSTSSRSTR